MKQFEPKPYQKNVFAELAKNPDAVNELTRPRRYHYGVDIGKPGGDRSVITRAKLNGKGEITQIVFDEFADLPDWKWWRNPIKWYKWRNLWKTVKRNMPNEKIR